MIIFLRAFEIIYEPFMGMADNDELLDRMEDCKSDAEETAFIKSEIIEWLKDKGIDYVNSRNLQATLLYYIKCADRKKVIWHMDRDLVAFDYECFFAALQEMYDDIAKHIGSLNISCADVIENTEDSLPPNYLISETSIISKAKPVMPSYHAVEYKDGRMIIYKCILEEILAPFAFTWSNDEFRRSMDDLQTDSERAFLINQEILKAFVKRGIDYLNSRNMQATLYFYRNCARESKIERVLATNGMYITDVAVSIAFQWIYESITRHLGELNMGCPDFTENTETMPRPVQFLDEKYITEYMSR